MAYSSGFNPHQRISYANPAPTGAESEAEYVEIGLAQAVQPAALLDALNDALPLGWVALAAAPVTTALTAQLTASIWAVDLGPVPLPVLSAGLADLLAAEAVEVTRVTKNGPRTFDARSAIVAATVRPPGLRLVLRHGEPLVRPDDVVAALRTVAPALAEGPPALVRRLAQGRLEVDGTLREPLPLTRRLGDRQCGVAALRQDHVPY
jgi:radical SAM-linked protein